LLEWTWDATSVGGWTCSGGPSLIKTYDGTPTNYGVGLRDHLLALG
jgi:endoglucanase